MWEEACRVNGLGPDGGECPFRWQRDPFVAAVLRAYATEDRLVALRPRMPAVLARGIEELCLQVRRAESWGHEQRTKKTGGDDDG